MCDLTNTIKPPLCNMYCICDALRDLVPFVQFRKHEKHPWKSVNFSKVLGLKPATLLKLTLFYGCFSRFLNCTNGTKSRNAPHIRTDYWEKIHLLSFLLIMKLIPNGTDV